MKYRFLATCFAVQFLAQGATAQPMFTSVFPPEEFAARRARVLDKIGPDAVAVLQGAAESPVYVRFRQNNNFFYLTGVEVPRALLLLDGRTKSAMLFLPARDPILETWDGPLLAPGDEAVKLTGLVTVRPRDQFGDALRTIGRERRILYTTFRRESLNSAAPDETIGHRDAFTEDPWDGRPTREAAFVEKLRAQLPHVDVRGLDPILEELRAIKSPREIDVLREANRVAGRALVEMMRSTVPGMHEYELEAIGQYFYHAVDGRQGYYAQAMSGKDNTWGRYHSIENELKSGDIVTVDFGPDYKYYVADVKRMWPVNGKFNAVQRETYSIFLRIWEAMEQSIKPNMAPRDIIREVVQKSDKILASFQFTNPKVHEAVVRMIESMRKNTGNSIGHYVGMDVHDGTTGAPPYEVLKPGMVFSIEEYIELDLPDLGAWGQLEDNYLVTETGIENLTAAVPRNPDDIEKLMTQPGLFKSQPAKTLSSGSK